MRRATLASAELVAAALLACVLSLRGAAASARGAGPDGEARGGAGAAEKTDGGLLPDEAFAVLEATFARFVRRAARCARAHFPHFYLFIYL